MDEQSGQIHFGATLGLPEAEAVRSMLLAALDGARGAITVDCSAATVIDLSFVQLLLAARRAAENRGKSLCLSAPASGALLDVLRRSGLLEDEVDGTERAFWTAAEAAA